MTIKPVSFRLDETIVEAFKELATKNGFTQTECFNALINNFELQKSKTTLGERKKEIEVFQDCANKLVSIYLNSLELNKSAESKIQNELSEKLCLKDEVISDLENKSNQLNTHVESLKNSVAKLQKQNKQLTKTNESLNELNLQNKKIADKNEKEISMIRELLDEHKGYKKDNIFLKAKNEEITKNIQEKEFIIKDNSLIIKNKDDKINDLQSNIKALRKELDKEKSKLDELRKEFKNETDNIKNSYDKKIEIERVELKNIYREKIQVLQEKLTLEKQKIEMDLNKKYKEHLKKQQKSQQK